MKKLIMFLVLFVFVISVCNVTALTISFRQGGGSGYVNTSVSSTYLSGQWSATNYNYGASDFLFNEKEISQATTRVLISFDDIFGIGSNQIPYGATIDNATFTIEKETVTDDNVVGVRLYMVTKSWVEGNQAGGPVNNPQQGVTWDNFNQTDSVIANVDHNNYISQTIPFYDHIRIDWNVKSMVQYWASNPGKNYGWMIVNNSTSSYNTQIIWDSEDRPINDRPTLTVQYTYSAPVVVPEPASVVFLLLSAGGLVLRWARKS